MNERSRIELQAGLRLMIEEAEAQVREADEAGDADGAAALRCELADMRDELKELEGR